MTQISLVSDIGGTNTRVALSRDGEVDASTVRRYRNRNYSGLDQIYTSFMEEFGVSCDGACIALAGPVAEGAGRLTNLDWSYDSAQLAAATGASTTALLNDLQAQGHAVPFVSSESLVSILPGPKAEERKSKLVIGVGTGFNSVPVFRTEFGHFVPPCETGHTSFPVLSEEDMSLARYVAAHHGFPGVEDVLSGRGIERIYAWASGEDVHKSSAEIVGLIAADADETARKTAEAFCRALGRVAGDLALTHLPFGGVYLTGGMAAAMRPHLSRYGFDDAFRDKGRFSEFMDQFAVWSVEDDYAALLGCARHIHGLIAAER
ncbi:glucokinase [Palleronia sp.]|uniref:glucokinase n=1 Tax=Palleronia sp. TaxID=1940284 RepID=UPI0035C85255